MSLMLQEIAEQPETLRRTIEMERGKTVRIGDFLRQRDIDLIVLVARGSSDNAALFGRYLLEAATELPVSLAAPSLYTLYDAKIRLNRALVIGVSQSGEGTDINYVLERAKASGAFTLAVTNQPGSTMASIADETLLIHAGIERSVAATKTYTGQMLHFYLLASAIGNKRLEYNRIPDLAAKALEVGPDVKLLAQRYAFVENCVVVGRGLNYGNTHELALKLMETCYVVAERFSSADLYHGPLALVERRFPIILFGPAGPTKTGNVELLRRLNELRADTLSITNDADIAKASSRCVMMPKEIDEFLTPIPFIVPGQLFAAYLAEAKGLDPDSPRSLEKITRTL
jgi:glutamine---fructose-6-phosphate transaminase (isomerizing)